MGAKDKEMIPCIMNDKINKIDEKLDDMQQSLKNVEIAIAGSQKLGIEGFAFRLDRQEKTTKAHQKIIWMGLGAIGLLSGLVELYRLIHA